MHSITETRSSIFSLKNTLLVVLLLFCYMPYISPVPLPTDVQPLFAVVGFLFIFIYVKEIHLNTFEIVFLLYSLLYLMAFSFVDTNDYFGLARKHLNYLLVFPIVLIVRNYAHLFSSKPFVFAISLYFLATILQFTLPSIYEATITNLYNSKEIVGLRGWTSLAPEPTDFGFTCIMLLVIALLMFEVKKITKFQFNLLSITLILMCLGTFSASGLISLTLIMGWYFSRHIFNFKVLIISIIIIIPVILNYSYLNENLRSFNLLFGLILDPLFIIEYTSLFYRMIDNIIAAIYFIDSMGLPTGVGGIYEVGPYIIEKYHLYNLFPSRIGFFHTYLNSPPTAIRNGFAQLLVELGWLGLIFIIICYRYILKSSSKYKYIVLLSFSLMMFQSFPIIYPLAWFQISFINNRKLYP